MADLHTYLPGDSEMHQRVRAFDWATTPLGPIDGWSTALLTQARTVLASRYPMMLVWGSEYIQIYNDAYSQLIGVKHPAALGKDVRVTQAEGWPTLRPLLESVMSTGEATWLPGLLLELDRSGYVEESYFAVSHAPAYGDDGTIVGTHNVCHEMTDEFIGERRLALLTELSAKSESVRDERELCAELCDAIADYSLDVPFVSLFLLENDAFVHRGGGTDQALRDPSAWSLQALDGEAMIVADVSRDDFTGGPWSHPVQSAVVLPMRSGGDADLMGALVCGVSPNRALDETYRSFFCMLARQVAVALSNSRAYQSERRRAQALEELDRVKTAFFSNMSHEIRTPMNAVVGGSALLLHSDLDHEQRDLVQMIQASGDHLLTIINGILDYSKLDSGRVEFRRDPFDPRACIASAISLVQVAADQKGLVLQVEVDGSVPAFVEGDESRLRQVLLNLLSNAVKFTDAGIIRVDASHSDGVLHLAVTDTGIGIPEDQQASVFDAFSQVRSDVPTGTGLGLSISKALTEGMGGSIVLASEVGSGSRFTVAVPAPATSVEPEATVDVRIDRALAHRLPMKILVADDDAVNRKILSSLLNRLGYEPETVDDGRAAVEAVVEGDYDLVLMDIQMPELDGLSAAEEIVARLPAEDRPRILGVTANAVYEDRTRALEAGMGGYLVKPVTTGALISALTEEA